MVFDKTKFISNLKAFTLFTAMVSFIVIGMAVLIIQHIANSEQNYTQIINSLYRQQEMDATKDLIRLDALQVFNLLYRTQVYTYFDTNTGETRNNLFNYNDISFENNDWNNFVNQYISNMYFGNSDSSNKFATYAGNKLIGLLINYQGTLKGTYFFRIFDYLWEKKYFKSKFGHWTNFFNSGEVPNIGESGLTNGLSKGFKNAKDNHDFYNLVKCPLGTDFNEKDCKNGSFYTNLYVNSISPDVYLDLPRIFIERTTDKSAMDDAILPRNIISLYVPFRIFGAMALARDFLNTKVNPPIKVETGNDIDYTNCSQFDGKDIADLKNLQSTSANDSDSIYSQVHTKLSSLPDTKYDFNLNLDDVEYQKEYTNKYLAVYVGNKPTNSYTTQKVVSAKFYFSVKDTDPFSSFGHGTGMTFGLSGIKRIVSENNEQLPVTITICNCILNSDSTLSCSNDGYTSKNKAGKFSITPSVGKLCSKGNTESQEFESDVNKVKESIKSGLHIPCD